MTVGYCIWDGGGANIKKKQTEKEDGESFERRMRSIPCGPQLGSGRMFSVIPQPWHTQQIKLKAMLLLSPCTSPRPD